ncbi:hypothetical protein MKW94_026930 [Papaver nudicaule]|uniref:DOG1 domain-containing protein n=1 Tax=Papaver nudicaule TaxID=74823 RepID=A0AA41S7V2_PAPNU|nr:hypothetical protein [Papaver nudicaule]
MADSSSDQVRFLECYQEWMIQQQEVLEELLQVYSQKPTEEQELTSVINKVVEHMQEYNNKRARLALVDATSFFSPAWCTSIENSYLWLAGCRPSLAIRLVYSLCGSELEAQLSEYFEGVRKGNLGELSADQLSLVSELQCRVIREEGRLSNKMAGLQEDIADYPLTRLANNSDDLGTESNGQVEQALDSHANGLASVLVESDKLRLSTLKELLGIFTPLQAVDYLIASKKLHLRMHQWGQRRDQLHGRA